MNHSYNQIYLFFQILYKEVNYSGNSSRKVEKGKPSVRMGRKVMGPDFIHSTFSGPPDYLLSAPI